jgi:hypothetical protein
VWYTRLFQIIAAFRLFSPGIRARVKESNTYACVVFRMLPTCGNHAIEELMREGFANAMRP